MSLPLSDILLAHRVDRIWKHVIDTSPQLQRALFLAPATDSTMALIGDIGEVYKCLSRDQCSVRNETHKSKSAGKRLWRFNDTHKVFRGKPILNPLVHKYLPALSAFNFGHETWKWKGLRLNGRLLRPQASWRRMLFSQPPVQELIVAHDCANHSHLLRASDATRGVTISEVHAHTAILGGELQKVQGIRRSQLSYNLFRSLRTDILAEQVLESFVEESIVSKYDSGRKTGEQ